MKQSLRRSLARTLSRLPRGIFTYPDLFPLWEKRGIHITPAHFYYPVPKLSELSERVWTEPSEMRGIDMRLEAQSNLAKEFSNSFFTEYSALVADKTSGTSTELETAYRAGGSFGGCDGAMLYAIIRKAKPKRLIEIGSGTSTVLSAVAGERNRLDDDQPCKITAIEPYPSDYLQSSLGGKVDIIQERVENVPLAIFEELEAGDIVFIDSSHTVKVGGDVVWEINEILPRLAKGVLIHVHDICFPYNYGRRAVLEEHKFWAEQYMLQAFLAFNTSFEVRWSFSYVQAHAPDTIETCFPFYAPKIRDHMGSFWMERVA